MKHSLKYGGTPFNADGTTVNTNVKDTKGTGGAACSCGWTSEPLETGAARKAAHKEHVASVSADETAAPAETGTEAEAAQPQEQTADEPREDTGVPVAYTGAAKSFWKALGVDGSAQLAEAFGGSVRFRTKDHTVIVDHEDPEQAQFIAEMLPRLWSESQPFFRDWKKNDKKYGAFDKRAKEGLAEAYAAELKFFTDLGRGVAASANDGTPKANGPAGYRAGVKLVESGGLDPVDGDDLI